ncbi:LysM peptidoglycan-binding domain-containing protein [Paenibacillus albidus]|uniref:3D domain-containing protein n=1 Tax=Paenibacillus albidus TaxID=2041023 RepID=UPI001BE76413|nr:LysM peptidoglycan-binding domain-containing protein [Paenibacillus albidus]
MKNRFRTIKAMAAVMGISALLHAVPAQADSIHVAKEGNTYFSLSKQYGVGVNQLMSANPGVAALNIYAGLEIKIPGRMNAKSVAAEEVRNENTDTVTASLNVEPNTSTVEAWGKVFNYNNTLQVKASAYSSAASENGKWGPVDYFGDPLKLGTIAVDPSVIPLGTKVLVTGHSHPGLPKLAFVAIAKDMGSAIKGNRIDIFIPGSQSFVADFGYQYVQLYVLD